MIVLKNILVATDFSEASANALSYGRHFARAYGATLHVLHVVDDVASRILAPPAPVPDIGRLQQELESGAQQSLDELITDEDRQALHARTILLTASGPAHAIVSYARDSAIDLIILGTHGRTGLSHFFMGSVAQHVVRAAPCPVLTVRQQERDFTGPDALVPVNAR